MTDKRLITPHKGGRTAALYVRIKPEVKQKLKAICKILGISEADWIERQVADAAHKGKRN